MAGITKKSFGSPDEIRNPPNTTVVLALEKAERNGKA